MNQIKIKKTSQIYHVGKVICIGRNYVDHITELGNEVPDSAVLFIKPASSILRDGGYIRIPAISNDCHHELELAVLIGKQGSQVDEKQALEMIAGYGIGIDLTLRDIQGVQKKKGLPWEIAKGFDTSCPLSDFVAADQICDPHNLMMTLSVNGEMRQNSSSSLMIRKIPQIIAEASQFFTLMPGDVVLTGTPQGVGQIVSGDKIIASIEQVGTLNVSVA